MIEALHVGPHVYSVGGTQSVIRVIRDHTIGADRVKVLPTWNGPSHASNAQLVAKAAVVLATVHRRTIIHFHISNGGAWLREGSLIQLANSRRLRTVVTLHGFEFPEFARSHPGLARSTLKGVGYLICLSDEARDELEGLLQRDNVSVVPNPVAIDAEAPPVNEVPPVALFAGTVELRKGVDVLVEAWRKLVASGTPGKCRIVGPICDFSPPSVERMSVEGPVHPDAVKTLVRDARVVTLPSRAEAMPMILAEALAAGRPIVATPVGGAAAMAPDPEMLVPVNDAAALAGALARYLGNPRCAREAGCRGQQYIIETRSPAVIDRRLRQIYSCIG